MSVALSELDSAFNCEEFYKTLYAGARGYIALCKRDPFDEGLKVLGFYPTHETEKLVRHARGLSGKAHIYHSVCTLKTIPEKGRGKKEDYLGAMFFAVDIDAKDFIGDPDERKKAKSQKDEYRWDQSLLYECKQTILERIASLELDPTAIVDSGHGFHAFYALQEFWSFEQRGKLEKFEELSRRLHKALGGDTTYDVTRVLRVAGTLNVKPGCPMLCGVVEFNAEMRYNLIELDDVLPPVGEAGRITPVSFAEKPSPVDLASLGLPECIQRAIETGDVGRYKSRSERDMGIVTYLLKAGLSHDQIRYIFQTKACGDKYREKKAGGDNYLSLTIGNAMGFVESCKTQDKKQESYNLTDLGNAKRLVRLHGQDFHYCHESKKWLVWDGRRWGEDTTGEMLRRAKDTVMQIYAEASREPDEERRRKLAKHAARSESEKWIGAMISLAQSEPGIPVRPRELDANPWLLNCLNGTLDLRTGELQPHRREDLLTKLVEIDYDPKATCPRWESFLNRIMNGNQNLIQFLQRAIGYTLTGSVTEQVFFICFGSGANGKTVFLRILQALLGEYGKPVDPELLMARPGSVHPTGRADLMGARLAVAIETEEGRRLNETLLKWLTGGDKLKARFMRQDFFEFEPTHKIWIATNHKPIIRGTDYAIWRRIRLIPFNVTIPVEDQDKRLTEKLQGELPGILAWAVRGCLAWQKDGLWVPEEVRTATEDYRSEMDIIAQFLEEKCVIDPTLRVKASDLYRAYSAWCEENNEQPLAQRNFGMRLSERGFERKVSNSCRWWHGISLKVLQVTQGVLKHL